jgi:3-oxoacyl-[acyl-carrier protein] reductase
VAARPDTVLVTGATGGIGSAVAAAFAASGARVARHGHTRVPNADAGGAAFTADLSAAEGCAALAKDVVAWAGGAPFGIVHAAGGARDATLSNATEADWDATLGVHLSAAWRLVRAAGVAPGGFVTLIGSGAGAHGRAGQAAYAAAKAGLAALAEALARELGPDGVRVNVVLPGPVETAMLAGLSPEARAALTAKNALGRLNTPEAVAAFVVHLASMGATSGQVFDLGSRVPGAW